MIKPNVLKKIFLQIIWILLLSNNNYSYAETMEEFSREPVLIPSPPVLYFIGNFSKEFGLKLDIKFNFDSWVIKEESFVILDNLSTEMKSQEWNSYNFVIEGHTDSQGPSEYNQQLSLNRANAVKNYLVKQGVHPNRLIEKGYGESRLLNHSNTEQAHSMNRRVVLKVLGPINKKNYGNIRVLVFANLSNADEFTKLNLSNTIARFQNLYKKAQVKAVISFTNEDCTRTNIFKSLTDDKDAVNVVFFIGDIVIGNDNELYFKTIDTDNDVIEYSALKLVEFIKILNKNSFIILPRYFSKQKLSTKASVITPHQEISSYSEQLRLLNEVIDIFEEEYVNASYGDYIRTVIKRIESIYKLTRQK